MTTEDQHGPHGGPLVKTDAGFVELSVYEIGVPPHFRLYFFDGEMKPLGLPGGADLTVETVRPEGTRPALSPTRSRSKATGRTP
jgi:hypothetical protein